MILEGDNIQLGGERFHLPTELRDPNATYFGILYGKSIIHLLHAYYPGYETFCHFAVRTDGSIPRVPRAVQDLVIL